MLKKKKKKGKLELYPNVISEIHKSQAPKPFRSLTSRLTGWVGEPHSLLDGALRLDINPSTFWLQLLLLVAKWEEKFLGTETGWNFQENGSNFKNS